MWLDGEILSSNVVYIKPYKISLSVSYNALYTLDDAISTSKHITTHY